MLINSKIFSFSFMTGRNSEEILTNRYLNKHSKNQSKNNVTALYSNIQSITKIKYFMLIFNSLFN